ncbi:MAG: YraN family protein [Clostridia bacterium]
MNKKATGNIGEEEAVNYLKKLGYKIVGRNVVCGGVEVDIIAKDGDTYVFCEVKTRNNQDFGLPVEAVTIFQQKRYVFAAKNFVNAKRLANIDIRFDIIGIQNDDITHYIDAFC